MKKIAGLLATTAILSGCATPYAEAPLATNFPTSQQQKLQAAAHWTTIARDVTPQLTKNIAKGTALYVSQPKEASPFQRTVASQVITSLVDAGYPVMKAPGNTLAIDLDVQMVQFAKDRPQYRYAGGATALGAGLWALHDVVLNNANGAAAGGLLALAAGDAISWFRSIFASGATPQTEIVVNATVSNATQYIARTTNVYYAEDKDLGLYVAALASKTIQVKGSE